MKFVYRPDGDTEQTWTYKPGKVRAGDAELIERRVGMTWNEFNQALAQGSVLARRALLWHFLRQTHSVLRFEDIDFAVGEVTLEFDRDEMRTIRDEMAKAKIPGVDDVARERMVAELDREVLAAPEPDEGKAPASNGG